MSKKALISGLFLSVFISTLIFSSLVHSGVLTGYISIELSTENGDMENSSEEERPFSESEGEDSKNSESKTEIDHLFYSDNLRSASLSNLARIRYHSQMMMFENLVLDIPNPPPQV